MYAVNMQTTTLPKLMTVREAADLLELHPESVRRLARLGRFPPGRRLLGHLVFDAAEVRKLARQRERDRKAATGA